MPLGVLDPNRGGETHPGDMLLSSTTLLVLLIAALLMGLLTLCASSVLSSSSILLHEGSYYDAGIASSIHSPSQVDPDTYTVLLLVLAQELVLIHVLTSILVCYYHVYETGDAGIAIPSTTI